MKIIKEPLFLPKGSIRAIILIILTFFIFIELWYNKIIPECILTLWVGIVGLYFGVRK